MNTYCTSDLCRPRGRARPTSASWDQCAFTLTRSGASVDLPGFGRVRSDMSDQAVAQAARGTLGGRAHRTVERDDDRCHRPRRKSDFPSDELRSTRYLDARHPAAWSRDHPGTPRQDVGDVSYKANSFEQNKHSNYHTVISSSTLQCDSDSSYRETNNNRQIQGYLNTLLRLESISPLLTIWVLPCALVINRKPSSFGHGGYFFRVRGVFNKQIVEVLLVKTS